MADEGLPERSEGKVPAAYILEPESTGLFYIGSSGDVRTRVLRHQVNLEAGQHHSQKLQGAFAHDDGLTVEVIRAKDKEDAF